MIRKPNYMGYIMVQSDYSMGRSLKRRKPWDDMLGTRLEEKNVAEMT